MVLLAQSTFKSTGYEALNFQSSNGLALHTDLTNIPPEIKISVEEAPKFKSSTNSGRVDEILAAINDYCTIGDPTVSSLIKSYEGELRKTHGPGYRCFSVRPNQIQGLNKTNLTELLNNNFKNGDILCVTVEFVVNDSGSNNSGSNNSVSNTRNVIQPITITRYFSFIFP